MKPSVILALAVACMAAPLAPSGAYKDALDIINRQGNKFSDATLKKRHGQEPDAFNIVFKDGVSIDQITEHLKLLDGLIDKDSLNGIKTAFDLPSQRDGSGLMGYTGHFDPSIVDALGKYSDLVTVEKDRVQTLPTFESFKPSQVTFQGAPEGARGLLDNFFKWWRTANPGQGKAQPEAEQPTDGTLPLPNQTAPIGDLPPTGGEDPLTSAVPSAPVASAPASVAPSAAPTTAPGNGSAGTFSDVPTKNWGLFRVSHQDNAQAQDQYSMNKDAKNPTVVYVVDSGIRTTHKMFEGRASWGANFADDTNEDFEGHGTHVAGTIGGAAYGVSPSTKLIAVKVFHQKSGTDSQIMQGVSWAIDDFVKNKDKYPRGVINFSGGGGVSDAEDALFKKAVEKGMVVAVAAGNDNEDACTVSPARGGKDTAGYLSVGASSSDDSFALWDAASNKGSNWGSCVDVIAPGTDILSADYQSDDGILANSGTSMATPHVAGLAAQLMATSSELLTPAQVEEKIINGNNGKITGNLQGTPNKLAYNGSGK